MKILGSHMNEHLQRQCKAQFVNRYTKEHKPTWATTKIWATTAVVQFESDAEWLANTFFEVTTKGELSRRSKYCESHPTWPDNPELRRQKP